MRDQHSSRQSFVSTGSEDFKGGFAEGFAFNAETASADGTELATQLDQVAEAAEHLASQAKEENERRQVAREYYEHKDSWQGKVEEFFHLEGPAPTGPESSPVTPPKPIESKGMARQSPLELATASNGVSSGNPENLRSYANGSAGLNEELSGLPGTLSSQLSNFASQCQFGSLNADGVITAFNDWMTANKNDVTWARTVADAFEAAGGEGSVATVSNASLFAALKNAGVNASRTDLKIPAAQVKGGETTTGYASDPINTANGNFIEPELDLAFVGAAQALRIERMYNSISETNGSFGPGWDSVLDVRLVLNSEGATCVMSDGRELFFPRQGDGWGRANAASYWLAKHTINGAERLIVSTNEAAQWAFNTAGHWLYSAQGEGTRIDVERDENARVSRLVHEFGRWISIERVASEDPKAPEQRIAKLASSDGRTASYEYNTAGQLISVTSTGAGTRRYEWNATGLIYKVIDAHGVVEAENTYDEKNRVTTQVSEFGRTTRFAYLPGLVTSVSDVDGSRSNTYVSDPQGRLISITDGNDQEQRMSYDKHGNLLNSIERDGGVTRHLYDNRGRRIRTKTRDGAELTYGYDEFDRITAVVAGNGGTTAFEYSDKDLSSGSAFGVTRNPSVVIDPMGGRSAMTWEHGKLTRVVDPTGVTVTLGYDEFGDLATVTNAFGNTVTYERDSAGRLIQAISPSGAITTFAYDSVGNLVRLTDAEGGTWQYEYGTNGRICASVDPTGGSTAYEYDPVHGHLVSTIDPLGRATEQSYDDLGHVETVTLANGAQWNFEHDLLSQLTSVTDPLGGLWRNEYGVNGDLTATVDPTGVRESASIDQKAKTLTVADAFSKETIKFDEFGRPVKSVASDGSAEVMVYDLAGRVVEFLDGEGHLTKFSYDLAGRMIEETSPSGAASRYEYDAAGRPSVMTDPSGAQVRLEYDADSRVVARHFSSEDPQAVDGWLSERTYYDRLGRVIAQGAARFQYDACGRITALQDPLHGTRRFQYDAAGQLTAVANGVGGVTQYEYDVTGNLVKTIDPLGNVSTREYDAAGRLVAQVDPLGRKTSAGYDAAGRLIWQRTGDEQEVRWTYDNAGNLKTVGTPTRVLAEYARDASRRCVTITDHTKNENSSVEHVLRYDGVGNLLSHTRDGQGPSWVYDNEGRIVSVTDPTGVSISYGHDIVGRVTLVEHPVFGQVVYTYNHEGELTSATAQPKDASHPSVTQSWEYAYGAISRHEVSGDGQDPVATNISRDDLGRIAGVQSSDGVEARYAFDGAHQLVGAYAANGTEAAGSAADTSGSQNTEWVYDTAGRLIRESNGGITTDYVYDAASQLISRTSTAPDGDVVTVSYSYDGAGRRVSEHDGAQERVFVWDASGRLSSITTALLDPATGARTGASTKQDLWVDALGDLAQIDGTDLWWDTNAATPQLLTVGETSLTHGPAGNTIIDGQLQVSGWRSEHSSHPATPWSQQAMAVSPLAGITGLPEHVQLTGNGQLNVRGLDWLGARLYDPSTRGFLSTDPLESTTGAGWASNPYSYAGNDPVHQIDPLGLSPVSAEELQAYSDAHQGWLNKAGHWVGEHWEVIAGVGLAVAGVALTCTGIGGPAGVALMVASGAMIGGGVSMATQELTTGATDWSKVGTDALIGAVSGPLMKFGSKPLSMLTGRVANVGKKAIGGVTNAAKNLASKLPGVAQKAKGALISARQSIGAQAQVLKARATTTYRGIAEFAKSELRHVRNGAGYIRNDVTRYYRGLSSQVRSRAQSATNRVRTGTSNFVKENWSDMWKTSVANSQVEGAGNLGWAYLTDDRSEPDGGFTFREGLGAYSSGLVSGTLGGAGPITKLIPNATYSRYVGYGLGAAGSEAALYTEKGINGEEITTGDHLWNIGTGAAMTHFPGAKFDDASVPENWRHLDPSLFEYFGYGAAGQSAGTGLEGLKFATEQTVDQLSEQHNEK